VIGTLWSVKDTTAASVCADVYRALARNGVLDPTCSAQALHEAVRRLRHDQAPPADWASLVHSGL
jgi:CHAT domain-containing protein